MRSLSWQNVDLIVLTEGGFKNYKLNEVKLNAGFEHFSRKFIITGWTLLNRSKLL